MIGAGTHGHKLRVKASQTAVPRRRGAAILRVVVHAQDNAGNERAAAATHAREDCGGSGRQP